MPGFLAFFSEPSRCFPDQCGCEAFRVPFGAPGIMQPWAAFSNLGFVLVGVCIFLSNAANYRHHPLLSSASVRRLFGATVVFSGFASAYLHSHFTLFGAWADFAGIAAVLSVVGAYFWNTRLDRGGNIDASYPAFLKTAVLLFLPTAGGLYLWPDLKYDTAVFLTGIVGAMAWIRMKQWRNPASLKWLKASVAVLAFAVTAMLVDQLRVGCHPDSWVQGHTIWHLGAATSFLLLFIAFRKDLPKRTLANTRIW